MYKGKKVVVVLPAYNAATTLRQTYLEIDFDLVDDVVLVDDASRDHTQEVAAELGIRHIVVHARNLGYGGNQKTCYDKALELGGELVIMLHPDYQYTPMLLPAMIGILGSGLYPVVFGSRILGGGALRGGMPIYKYIANRLLTLTQNILLGQKLSEYHTGYRGFTSEVLRKVPYHRNSNNFIFDNEMIAQIFGAGFQIAEITCPTKYFPEASSINLRNSAEYGLGVLSVSFRYWLHKKGFATWELLK
jgi:glycosyltransferase involved in cell wall biosynthesis